MRRTKAFTLIELMVVVAIIALLAAMLLPALTKALENAKRVRCLGQLKGLGTALALYSNDNGAYPLIPGTAWDSTKDGTAYTTGFTGVTADWSVARSVSSLMFMLVRNGQGPNLFCCPSDTATPDTATSTQISGVSTMNWDFSGEADTGTTRNVSYSYQCPINRSAVGNPDTNGISNSADPSLVVMSDRIPQAVGTVTWANWTGTPTPDVTKTFVSQNHTSGAMMNLLYADSHADKTTTPNYGPTVTGNGKLDCIFTCGTQSTTYPQDGVDMTTGVAGVIGTPKMTSHTGLRDSYLSGGW